MTPWQRAQAWQQEHGTEDFWQLLGWHLSRGVVYAAQDAFLLAREVAWDAERKEISIDESAPRNAWFVQLAATADNADAFGRFMRVAPHPHPWVLWCRRGEMRVREFQWNKLQKKVRTK